MLEELRQTVSQRLENSNPSYDDEQKDIDNLTIKIIEKINSNKDSESLIPIKTPSEKVGKTIQCLLAQHGVITALYENILFVKPPFELN